MSQTRFEGGLAGERAMRSPIRIIAVVLFCWAVFGLLSLLSDLKFFVDGVDLSIAHVSILVRDFLLTIGKWISEAVSGYRELVRGLARLLHLPRLPPVLYDVVGVLSFSIGCGFWLGRRDVEEQRMKNTGISIDRTDVYQAYKEALGGLLLARPIITLFFFILTTYVRYWIIWTNKNPKFSPPPRAQSSSSPYQ
jgi:hypothetical protein